MIIQYTATELFYYFYMDQIDSLGVQGNTLLKETAKKREKMNIPLLNYIHI